MTQHTYTQDEATEFTVLGFEAGAIESESRTLLTQASNIIDRVVGRRYIGWELDYTELSDLVDAIQQEFRVAPYRNWMPKVGQFTIKPQRIAEWRKLNNRARREVAKLQRAIAAHA